MINEWPGNKTADGFGESFPNLISAELQKRTMMGIKFLKSCLCPVSGKTVTAVVGFEVLAVVNAYLGDCLLECNAVKSGRRVLTFQKSKPVVTEQSQHPVHIQKGL